MFKKERIETMHQLSVSNRESRSILLVNHEKSNCEFSSILSRWDLGDEISINGITSIKRILSLTIYRLSNQRICYKYVDQRDDERTIAAVTKTRAVFTCEFIHVLFNGMAAGSGGRKNQFMSLHYGFEELEGVYIFKRVQNYSAYTYVCIERTRSQIQPSLKQKKKKRNQSYQQTAYYKHPSAILLHTFHKNN